MFEGEVATVIRNCPAGTVFLAAVSGGADSMAMLAALCAAVQKDSLHCIHVEHGLRPPEESSGDAEFVRDFCEKLKINCIVHSVPAGKIASFAKRKGTGIEAAARFFRRRALLREAARLGDNALILTAHTKDDALETSLMRVLRGSGPSGLAAMPQRRGRFLRPLLSMTRADVIGYLKEKNIPWREDSTNTDKKFLRNRIRHQLIPFLNESFPSWKSGLAAMAETQSLAAAFIGDEAQNRIEWVMGDRGCAGMLSANERVFFSQPEIVREEALFQGIDKIRSLTGKGKDAFSPKRSVIRRFCAGLVSAADLGLLRVRRENGKIVISAAKRACFESGVSLLIK